MRTLPPEMTCGFLIQLVFCKKKTMWFIGVEVEQETSAPPPKKILDPALNVTNNRRPFNCDNRRIEAHQLLITSLHSQ